MERGVQGLGVPAGARREGRPGLQLDERIGELGELGALAELGAPTRERRLAALRALAELGLERPAAPGEGYVNNHIHTTYSFSPYTPAKAAYMAWASGLLTAGIMDHDSVGGAEEFAEAGRLLGVATTVGVEVRCSFASTPFAGRRLNNTDQDSVAYLALHGIPRQSLPAVERFAAPLRARRLRRSREMVGRVNSIIAGEGIELDFDRDVAGISMAAQGGTVTERHILYALARKLVGRHGAGGPLLSYLRGGLRVAIPEGLEKRLEDAGDADYLYRLLGLLKGHFLHMFYVDATDELPDVREFVELASRTGGIAAYAYLGDVRGSVTGDKRDEAFEDSYLDGLVEWLAKSGFQAVTYMPARNTPEQLSRLAALCRARGLFQISGEDINTPFQPFVCEELAKPQYRHLVESTWALIGHEEAASGRLEDGMFSVETLAELPALDERVARFAAAGRAMRRGKQVEEDEGQRQRQVEARQVEERQVEARQVEERQVEERQVEERQVEERQVEDRQQVEA